MDKDQPKKDPPTKKRNPNPVPAGGREALSQSNSGKEKQRKKVEAVVTEGTVEHQKPSLIKRMKNNFLGGDVDSVGRYLVHDVFLPAIRNLIVESASQGVERMIFGETSSSRSRNPRRNYRYDNPTNPRRQRGSSTYIPDRSPRHERDRGARWEGIGAIVLTSKSDAERVLERLTDLIDSYEFATVADLFELLGDESNNYTDNKFGWYELPYARVRQVRDGFLLDIPDAIPLDDD